MKKKITFPIILATLLCMACFTVPKYIQSVAEKELQKLNYSNATIGKTDIGFNRVTFKDIHLTNDQSIKKIIVHATPLSFIGLGEITHIELDGLEIKIKTSSLIKRLREDDGLFFKNNIPAQKISLSNSKFHFQLLSKDLEIEITGSLEKQLNTQDIKIMSALSSQDETIAFDGAMSGLVTKTGTSSIDLNINNVSLNHKLASIDRATGWLNVTQENTSPPNVSGQIDADSGSILKLPTKNMSAVLGEESKGEENKNYALILRAQAAGVDGVDLFTDMSYGGSSSDLNMQSTLDIKNTKAFATYLESLKLKSQDMPSFTGMNQTKITTRYLPERRFVDGPLPFDVTADNNKTNILNGTFLVYPTDMEIRGNAQTNPKHTRDIQVLLSIPDEKVSNDTLRLDGSISTLF